jgi:LAO/AO transport system ATPase
MTNNIKILFEESLKGNRRSISKIITFLESQLEKDFESQCLILSLISKIKINHPAKIIGITGAPGAGKSTLINALGQSFLKKNKDCKLAILAIDPSSEESRGSLLADKARMSALSGHENVFIRPSSNQLALGGFHPGTPFVIRFLEVLGFDCIFVETLGVGQSETQVKNWVDCLCVLIIPGLGDESQAMKRGLIDYANLLLISKKDLNPDLTEATKMAYLQGSQIKHQKTEILEYSSNDQEDIDYIKDLIDTSCQNSKKEFPSFETMISQKLRQHFFKNLQENHHFQEETDTLSQQLLTQKLHFPEAFQTLKKIFLKSQ